MPTPEVRSFVYNVLCDRCGWKMKNYQVRKDWQGFIVCKTCYEPRHPLDFYTTPNDVHLLPFYRSENNGVDVSPNGSGAVLACNPITNQGKIGVGAISCAQIGKDIGLP